MFSKSKKYLVAVWWTLHTIYICPFAGKLNHPAHSFVGKCPRRTPERIRMFLFFWGFICPAEYVVLNAINVLSYGHHGKSAQKQKKME